MHLLSITFCSWRSSRSNKQRKYIYITVARGVVKTFTCPNDGNPEPNIEWYNEKTGTRISNRKQLTVGESGCYTCVSNNSLGTSVNITQCLIVGKSAHAHDTITLLHIWNSRNIGTSRTFFLVPALSWTRNGIIFAWARIPLFFKEGERGGGVYIT